MNLNRLQASRHVTRHRADRDTLEIAALVMLLALAVSPIVAGILGLP